MTPAQLRNLSSALGRDFERSKLSQSDVIDACRVLDMLADAAPVAWYIDRLDPHTGIESRSVTFDPGSVTARHKPLYGIAPLLTWQPISAAPTDGTHCIVAYDCPAGGWIVRDAWFRDSAAIQEMNDCGSYADESDIGWWWYRNSCTQEMIYPTHFLCETPESPK